MLGGPPGAPWAASNPGSRDGRGAGDHNQPFDFGRQLSTRDFGPFSLLQFCRLLCLRSHVQDGDRVPEELVLSTPERFGLTEPDIILATGAPLCFDDNCPLCQAFLESLESP